ncbi:MAG TPA: hypothetical protein VH229_07665 [Candidatus Udaeobacter sp.]|nr:hypothetical protein [Candidatus Udaeobacter sp.]
MKRFILAFFAAYIFIFFWGWLLNGVFLKDVYAETPNLWRPQSEMMSLFHWIIIGQALVVFGFVMIYASGFAGGGVRSGGKAWSSAGDCSDRNAPWILRSATDSRKTDSLRKYQRPGRDDYRRGAGRRDL